METKFGAHSLEGQGDELTTENKFTARDGPLRFQRSYLQTACTSLE